MPKAPELKVITAADILEVSSEYPVGLQDNKTDVLDGFLFSDDEIAVAFKALERPETFGKLDIPLAMPMHAAFHQAKPSTDRRAEDFRIVLEDREVAPAADGRCEVRPYELFNGIVSVVLRLQEETGSDLFMPGAFRLNVYEPGMVQPFSNIPAANLQVTINPSEQPPEDVVLRYLMMKQKAGLVLQGVFNTPVTED